MTHSLKRDKSDSIQPNYNKPDSMQPNYNKPDSIQPNYNKTDSIQPNYNKPDSIQPNYNKNVEDYMVFLAKSLFLKQEASSFCRKNRK